MATSQEYDQAINAVRTNQATAYQKWLTDRAASQAGSRGYEARQAIQESGKQPRHWLF